MNFGLVFSGCLRYSLRTSFIEFPIISGMHQPFPSSPVITAFPVFLFTHSQSLSPIFSQVYGLSLRGFPISSGSILSTLTSIACSVIGSPSKYRPIINPLNGDRWGSNINFTFRLIQNPLSVRFRYEECCELVGLKWFKESI